MRIVFIEPRSPNLHIFSRFKLPRIGCTLLATIARDHGHGARVFVEELAEIDWNEVKRADLVGISTITSTAPRAYALADKIRRMGIKVVLGGPHVTYLPEEAVKHADFVLLGEAEYTFLELLEHIEGKRPEKDVHNLVRAAKGRRIVRTEPSAERVDIDKNPAPDFSLVRGFQGAATNFHGRVIPIQVSRGCPHDCSFCSVTGMFGRKMRYRSTENVLRELSQYNDKKYHIFFYDDNFAASPRRAKELIMAMLRAGTKFTWSTQVRADAARDVGLLELMSAANCLAVYIGVESANPETLRLAKKRQDVEETRENLLRFKKAGIDVHGMFVLGFDTDGPDAWKAIVQYAKESRIATIQALILTPLPGSRTFDELNSAGRIMFKDWSLYDSHHVVFRHPTMSPEQLQNSHIQAHRAFYSNRKIARGLMHRDWANVAIAVYARGLQSKWIRKNDIYMKALKLLNPTPQLEVVLDMKMPVLVD